MGNVFRRTAVTLATAMPIFVEMAFALARWFFYRSRDPDLKFHLVTDLVFDVQEPLVSPTNRRLDSRAQSCGLSLPTFTRERIGIMPAHRIGLPGVRDAFAGYCGPRLPIPAERGGMRVPNGLPLPTLPKGNARLRTGCKLGYGERLRTARRCIRRAPRAGPADRTTNV
jgi:hypothetical protein